MTITKQYRQEGDMGTDFLSHGISKQKSSGQLVRFTRVAARHIGWADGAALPRTSDGRGSGMETI